MKHFHFRLPVYFLCLWLISCEKPKDPDPDNPPPQSGAEGIYILNEGLMDMNNSSLSYYNFNDGTVTHSFFRKANGRGLGDTGNDLQQYGSKLYCIVNISEQLEIMDAHTCRSLKQIPLIGKKPRKIAFHKNKAYISCFDGSVVKIDTASMEIETTIRAGRNPEGICVANNKLYVANSGGLNYPDYNNTVSVFDLNSFSLIKNIEVATNPYILAPDHQGDIYLVSKGNYGSVPHTFQRIDSRTDEVVQNFNLPVLNFTISGNYAYLYHYNFNTNDSWVKVMDVVSEKVVKENFISDGTDIQTPYGIMVNPVNGDVYITDAHLFTVNGDVYCFDKNGKKKFQFEAGLNPSCMVLLENNKKN